MSPRIATLLEHGREPVRGDVCSQADCALCAPASISEVYQGLGARGGLSTPMAKENVDFCYVKFRHGGFS